MSHLGKVSRIIRMAPYNFLFTHAENVGHFQAVQDLRRKTNGEPSIFLLPIFLLHTL